MPSLYHFAQFWLSQPDPSFHPGSVNISRSEGRLHFHAELFQPQLTTKATAHQQRLWELGDVVELFVQTVGEFGYDEYQIAPNGMMLALHYPNQDAVTSVRNGERKMEEFLSDLPGEGNTSVTATGWRASLSIPASDAPLRINCGRYDYSSSESPVVSSIAPLTKRDFHRLEEWLLIK
jgi:hypothetical protein